MFVKAEGGGKSGSKSISGTREYTLVFIRFLFACRVKERGEGILEIGLDMTPLCPLHSLVYFPHLLLFFAISAPLKDFSSLEVSGFRILSKEAKLCVATDAGLKTALVCPLSISGIPGVTFWIRKRRKTVIY